MGIFGGGYNKPGKGVDKNEPKKKGFFLFFEIVIRKFTKFLGLNCLYTMTSIIWIILLYLFGGIILANTNVVENTASQIASMTQGIDMAEIQGSVMVSLQAFFAIGIFSLWGSGPATASYAYITRCFTRGEHAWVVSDGIDKLKENFKKGMFVVIADAVVLVLGINAAYFYYGFYITTGSILWMLLTYVTMLILVLYTMIHPYLYQIMVTFECSIGAMYKNALLMMIAKLPQSFLILAVEGAILFLLFTMVNPMAAALITIVVGLCVTHFPGQFHAARVIERYILKDMKKKPEIEYIGEEE